MSKRSHAEAQLDEALGTALLLEFQVTANWFLSRTQFSKEVASCVWCRWDNPYSIVRQAVKNAVTDELENLVMERETDILAVFATGAGRRLALHIENKLLGSSFTPHQPESYQARKSQWSGCERLGNYTEATSVLIAPVAFYERFRDRAALFDSFISHEDIAKYIPMFGLL